MKRFDPPTERRALRLLRDALDCINDEVNANVDAMDHPIIRKHARVADRSEKFLAREGGEIPVRHGR